MAYVLSKLHALARAVTNPAKAHGGGRRMRIHVRTNRERFTATMAHGTHGLDPKLGSRWRQHALRRAPLDRTGAPREKAGVLAASYFDVDGTLIRTNLVHPTLWYLMHQRTPMRSLQKLARAAWKTPQMIWAEMQDRRMFNEILFSSYEGISKDRLLILADDAFEQVMKKALYPHAKDLVSRSRDEGHDVVLVSGALDFLMTRLADHLGATHVIANRLEIKDGYATGRLLRPVVAGPEKARLIRDHAREHGHNLDDCFGYSDSYSDVPMLSVVGHPAAVNPDSKLERLARTYGWPVLTLEKSA